MKIIFLIEPMSYFHSKSGYIFEFKYRISTKVCHRTKTNIGRISLYDIKRKKFNFFFNLFQGDLIPQSSIGKFFGSFFILFGILIALLPVPILSCKFERIYKEFSQENKDKNKIKS